VPTHGLATGNQHLLSMFHTIHIAIFGIMRIITESSFTVRKSCACDKNRW